MGEVGVGKRYFATALIDADMTEVLDRPRYLAVLKDLCSEIIAVADAMGIQIEAFDGFDAGALRLGARDPQWVAACWAAQLLGDEGQAAHGRVARPGGAAAQDRGGGAPGYRHGAC